MDQKEKKEIIGIVLNELESRGILRKGMDTFKKTEKLLYEYPNLKESITKRKEQIKDLEQYGLQQKSKSITGIFNGGVKEDEDSIIQNNINSLQQHIYRTTIVLKHIDSVLATIKDDKYFDIIKKYYFENMTFDQVAEYFDTKLNKKDRLTSQETIRLNKNRLINKIKTLLLPNDLISEILGYWQIGNLLEIGCVYVWKNSIYNVYNEIILKSSVSNWHTFFDFILIS